jgi:hypothetical protein
MRDRCVDPLDPDAGFADWQETDVKLSDLYELCYVIDPDKSWALQRRNQRQSMRRALGRLSPTYVCAFALAWCEVGNGDLIRWQGGGRPRDGIETPNWKTVGITADGLRLALLLDLQGGLEQHRTEGNLP